MLLGLLRKFLRTSVTVSFIVLLLLLILPNMEIEQ